MPSEEERMESCGPGRSLAPEAEFAKAIRARMQELQGKAEQIQGESPGDRKGCHVSLAPLAVEVNGVVKQRDGLCHLCAEMLATFELPANRESVAAMGPRFPDILAQWKRQFEKYSGEA